MARNDHLDDPRGTPRSWGELVAESVARHQGLSSPAHQPTPGPDTESSNSGRPGTPGSLDHMKTDGVAPGVEEKSGKPKMDDAAKLRLLRKNARNRKRWETALARLQSKHNESPPADAPMQSEVGLDLNAFFASLSEAQKAEVLKPMILRSQKESDNGVTNSSILPDRGSSAFDKRSFVVTLNQRNDQTLNPKQGMVDSQSDLGDWVVPNQAHNSPADLREYEMVERHPSSTCNDHSAASGNQSGSSWRSNVPHGSTYNAYNNDKQSSAGTYGGPEPGHTESKSEWVGDGRPLQNDNAWNTAPHWNNNAAALESGGGNDGSFGDDFDPAQPVKVSYWIQLDSPDDTIYWPIHGEQVCGLEKHIAEGNLQKVWKWCDSKNLRSKVPLEDMFDVAEVVTIGDGQIVMEREQQGKAPVFEQPDGQTFGEPMSILTMNTMALQIQKAYGLPTNTSMANGRIPYIPNMPIPTFPPPPQNPFPMDIDGIASEYAPHVRAILQLRALRRLHAGYQANRALADDLAATIPLK